MQLTMLLLMIGTALVFAGRSHVLSNAGIPPRTWIGMEAILSSGPAFGWWCLSLGESSLALALAFSWTFVGILSFAFAHYFVKKCSEKEESNEPSKDSISDDELTNPMAKALLTFQRIDRTIDFDALGEEQEQVARTRRKKIASSG